MDAFERELARRSPLAACVLETADHVFDSSFLQNVYENNRGRCYEDTLSFEQFLELTRDALIRHEGSAHQLFLELEATDSHPVNESNFYRKLARMPVEVSRALLCGGADRIASLMPGPSSTLAACFDDYEVLIGDGKVVKDVCMRLKPARGFAGKLLGAKALVAIDARNGLALAMNDSLDAHTNDVPLVPGLMEQLRQVVKKPILSVWDRQFDDARTLNVLSQRPGDAFIVRMKRTGTQFVLESSVESEHGTILDEIGLFGTKSKVRVRRITLRRPGQTPLTLLTNLTDRAEFGVDDVLELYRQRWEIEKVFQQVTQTFSLTHLIGCRPRAVLFQLAYCLLLYNLMQLIRAYVAGDGGVLAGMVSIYYLFVDTREELRAWAYHTNGLWPRFARSTQQMRRRLKELTRGLWNAVKYTKASDKKPREKPKPTRRFQAPASVQRVLEGTARILV